MRFTQLTPMAASVLALCAPALAQEQRVEITGSAIKRVDAEGALPITVITREEIARSGAINTEELVNSIAAVASIGGINNATGAGSSTAGRSTISLRGLSGGRTLVLVNGRRLAVSVGGLGGSVNVNNIPLAAIERVEVLKDGASAVYGSDAISGVINFITRQDYRGLDVIGHHREDIIVVARAKGGVQFLGQLCVGAHDFSPGYFLF